MRAEPSRTARLGALAAVAVAALLGCVDEPATPRRGDDSADAGGRDAELPTIECACTRWDMAKGCVATSYDPTLVDQLARFTEALADVAAVDCSDLCFQAPVAADRPSVDPVADRRLHWSSWAQVQAAPGVGTVASSTWDRRSCSILEAELGFETPPVPSMLRLHVLRAAGVVADTPATPDAPLTAGDRSALCALYAPAAPPCAVR